jgi:hypothetical protein
VAAQATTEIEQPVDAVPFMQWVARFIEAADCAPTRAPASASAAGSPPPISV